MSSDHDAIFQDWQKNAARNEDATFRFLHSLKMASDLDHVDAVARELHEDAFRKVDCTRCANCCKTLQPGLSADDIDRISGHLGMSRETLIQTHLEQDPHDSSYRTKTSPCPFLGGDDRCTIYSVRPESCRGYPHTDKEGFTERTSMHTANARSCPAVYHIVQQLRRRLRRSDRSV